MAKASKVERGQGHTLRSVQPISMFQTKHELPRRFVDVHEPQSRPIGFKLRSFLMEHIGHDNVVADGLDKIIAVGLALRPANSRSSERRSSTIVSKQPARIQRCVW